VTVGGGSPMDVAKAVGILASNPGELLTYVGLGKVVYPLPPLVAIPTTVGTGSEVTNFSVITDRDQRKKVVFGSPLLAPRFALLDPELVLSLPTDLVAATGMDALTHAIESVISDFATPFSDALALEAIQMIAAELPVAVKSAELEARGNVLYASTLAGLAFSYARTGLVHGMSHPLSSYCDVPHGLANAILLPYVLAFNAPACEAELSRVATAMGQPARAQAAIDAVRRLSAEVAIPPHLSDVGVTEEFIPNMAQDAFESGNAQVVNPRKPTLAQVVELYRQAF
jgi:alcohol dehydrogenase class IV